MAPYGGLGGELGAEGFRAHAVPVSGVEVCQAGVEGQGELGQVQDRFADLARVPVKEFVGLLGLPELLPGDMGAEVVAVVLDPVGGVVESDVLQAVAERRRPKRGDARSVPLDGEPGSGIPV
jgi:hypothetical protein